MTKTILFKGIVFALLISCTSGKQDKTNDSNKDTASHNVLESTPPEPSKDETEKWIIEKLTKYSRTLKYPVSSETHVTERDYIPSISNDSLIVEYKTISESIRENLPDLTFTILCNKRIAASINDIDSVKIERFTDWNTPIFTIFTKRQSTKQYENCTTQGKNFDPNKVDSKTSFDNSIVIGFNDKGEQNIETRLKEAFANLKVLTYKKEAF